MTKPEIDRSRRRFFEVAAIGVGGAVFAGQGARGKTGAQASPSMAALESGSQRLDDIPAREPDFRYEVRKSDAEWKEQLTEDEFKIMRLGFTEFPKSSPLWNETRPGLYRCKGCGLLNYLSERKVVLDKGWAFFHHSEPDSVLTGMEQHTKAVLMEAHCRRCGSHLGHIVSIKNKVLHCINGASLEFTPA